MLTRIACVFWLSLAAVAAWAQFPAAADNSVLKGAADLHIHTAPDIFDRSINDLELAQICKNRGMKSVVIKNHVSSTAGRAELVNAAIKGINVYGGIVLNRSVGGLNPEAVENMAKLSPKYGKIVWLPTFDSQAHVSLNNIDGKGIESINQGVVTKELDQVLDVIQQYQLVLATGHLSANEVMLVVKLAKKKGIEKILITHALSETPDLKLDQMKELASLGAKIELTFLSSLSGTNAHVEFLKKSKHVSIESMAAVIQEIGASHFILTSDLGQSGNPIPPDGLKRFAHELINYGITHTEMKSMIVDNPAELLGY